MFFETVAVGVGWSPTQLKFAILILVSTISWVLLLVGWTPVDEILELRWVLETDSVVMFRRLLTIIGLWLDPKLTISPVDVVEPMDAPLVNREEIRDTRI